MAENTEWRTKTALDYQHEACALYLSARLCRSFGFLWEACIAQRCAAEASEKARDALLCLLWEPF